jgi:hypothetical protein
MEIRLLLNELASLRGFKPIDWDTPSREAILQILTNAPNT